MNAVSLGPLVMAADRFAAVLGIFVFMIVAGLVARRAGKRLQSWSWWVLGSAIIAARLGHVVVHWNSFAQEPLRILAVWQGGFYWPPAVVAVALSLVLVLKDQRLRLWALLPLMLGLVVGNAAWQITGTTRAVALPAAAFQTLDGQTHELESRSDVPKVINLWATWCPPCRREMPMMAEIASSRDDVEFVFANQGEGREDIEGYLQGNNIKLGTVLLDPFREMSRHYGAPGLPATLFISADGALRYAHLGEISRENLQTRIAQLRGHEE